MKNDVKKNVTFNWQDNHLINTLLKQFEIIHYYYKEPKGLKESKELLEINKYT